MRPTTMRTTMVLAASALVTAMVSGCAPNETGSPDVATAQSGPAAASSSPSAATSDDSDAPLKYAKCMRENGMTWFPDPNPDSKGRITINLPAGVTPEDMQKAEQACREWAPNGGEKQPMSAEDLEMARQMAKCMRENGVPEFPDPNPDGGIQIDGSKVGGPGDPAFDKAEQKCSQYMPKGSDERGTGVQGGGGE
ncbi:hypothetical protein ACQP2E_05470 [Actinoplanes sp. CA-015351]|uniref:hypothetical protein n=1 Tax=Actinoplanes sp. CA-015351 TaxID=3239897 RepID=UPI003D964967